MHLLLFVCLQADRHFRIGYVEFRSIELVDKAISLSGTIVMGLPIQIQHTEAERNRLHPGDGYVANTNSFSPNPLILRAYSNLNLPPGVSAPHGGMQSVIFNCDDSNVINSPPIIGYTLVLYISTSRNPTSSRSLSRLANLNSSIFTETHRPAAAKVTRSFSKLICFERRVATDPPNLCVQIQASRGC